MSPEPRPRAFTLVEMLVVLVMILVLATLTVAILPGAADRRATARAADQLQGWLYQARGKATRDQLPRGLRLIQNTPGECRTCEYIGQPEPLTPRTAAGAKVTLTLRPPAQGNPNSTAQLGAFPNATNMLQIGDLLEVLDGEGQGYYRITSPFTPGQPFTITPDPATFGPIQTTNYRLVRRWRSLAGEPILELPAGTLIDLAKNQLPPSPAPDVDSAYGKLLPVIGGDVVILFTPAAGVILGPADPSMPATPAANLYLWVRHAENKGEPTLIVVYSRSGSIAAHPVYDEKAPGMQSRRRDPFRFAEDAQSSGL